MIDQAYIVASSLPLSANADKAKIAGFIPREERKIKGMLPLALYQALLAENKLGTKAWSKNNSYVADDKVTHVEDGLIKVWKSLTTNSASEPTTDNDTDWDEVELGTFLEGHVRPLLAHAVFVSYAVNGGVNLSHQGLQRVFNETTQPVEGNALQAFLNYWEGEKESIRVGMFDYLDVKNHILDSVTYKSTKSTKRPRRSRFRPVGTSRVLPNQNEITGS